MTYTSDNRNDADAIPPRPPGAGGRPARNIDLGGDSGALLAAVPGMLGFRPENSMIFLGLSRPQGDAGDTPERCGSSSEVGPVIRADLTEESVLSATVALERANRGRSECGVVIAVVGGDAGPLVDAAAERFREAGIRVVAGFVATDLCAGALWWEIPLDGAGNGAACSPGRGTGGRLPDPADSPTVGDGRSRVPGQQEFNEQLDTREIPVTLVDRLPASWVDEPRWEEFPADTSGYRDIAGLCSLVDDLGELLEQHCSDRTPKRGTHRGAQRGQGRKQAAPGAEAGGTGAGVTDRENPGEAVAEQIGCVVSLLETEGVATFVAAACDRDDMYPVFAVLAAGPRGAAVRTLLTVTAGLSRGLLRQRALALLAVAAWCSSGGVLAHRASHRAVAEITGRYRYRWMTGRGKDLRHGLRRAERTLALAGPVMEAAERGGPSPVVSQMLDRGIELVDRAASRCPGRALEELAGVLDRVLDRQEVNDVRNELDRRVRR
ncbi:DUF4192 family protein [Corynebacterium provencense]|uniref:DUF4192 family protein n=1 Tax=Corynebacterium provencense TaxID=1737425 RepID=UPI00098E994C|nr:DUF4192 family protein [Corynebacterium provencense]